MNAQETWRLKKTAWEEPSLRVSSWTFKQLGEGIGTVWTHVVAQASVLSSQPCKQNVQGLLSVSPRKAALWEGKIRWHQAEGNHYNRSLEEMWEPRQKWARQRKGTLAGIHLWTCCRKRKIQCSFNLLYKILGEGVWVGNEVWFGNWGKWSRFSEGVSDTWQETENRDCLMVGWLKGMKKRGGSAEVEWIHQRVKWPRSVTLTVRSSCWRAGNEKVPVLWLERDRDTGEHETSQYTGRRPDLAGTGFHTGHTRLMKLEWENRQGFGRTNDLMGIKSEPGRRE